MVRTHEPTLAFDRLKDIGLFGGWPEEALRIFLESVKPLSIETGSVVFHEGDEGREMFVLVDGEMEIVKRSKRGSESRVAILGPGDWFGEMSILDVQPRSATVRAIAPSRLMCITAQALDGLYRSDQKSYALLVLNIAREMSRRLRVADRILADLVATVLEEYAQARGSSR